MYYVSAKSSEESFILRPEATASVVRMALEHSWERSLPKKVFYNGPMFRHEKPQKGRLRQFNQIGAEFLGGDTSLADVEVVYSGYKVIKEILGSSDCMEVEENLQSSE